jgi:hypothetical protein
VNKFTTRTIFAVVLLMGLAGSVHAQTLDPIAVSFGPGEGQNSIGLPAADDPDPKTPITNSSGDFYYYLFLVGEDDEEHGIFLQDGLPTNGTIVSASNTAGKITTFQLAPYTGPNVLVSDGTLMLTTSASYSNLAFLINSVTPTGSRFQAPATFTLNFSEGPSTILSTQENVPDWIGGEPGVAGGSVALSTPALDEVTGGFFESNVNFDEYDFVLSSADAAKTLVSIDVGAGSGELLTYAVSGTLSAPDPPGDPPDDPLPVPEPPIWSLVGLTLAGAFLVRRTRLVFGA